MNKGELVLEVKKILGRETSKVAAERAVDAVLDGIKRGVKRDKMVQLLGFGTFNYAKRAARKGVNPRTGEAMRIKSSKTVKFKVGLGFRSIL